MATIKKKDFVELEYTGKLIDGTVFDTTDEKLAKELNLHNPKMEYGSITICIGEGYILRSIDEFLEGKEDNKEYNLELPAEKAFGKKSPKLLKMIPGSVFRKQGINPLPGLQVNIDGMYGIVKVATGGRIIVDFNHPLSSKDVVYTLNVKKVVTDAASKIGAALKFELGIKENDFEFKEGTLKLKTKQELPKEAVDKVNERFKDLIPEINSIEFIKVEDKKE